MTTSYPLSVIIAHCDSKATFPQGYCPITAWDSWHDLQSRANLTSFGKWTTPSPSDPEYKRYWDVHMRGFAQTAYLVRPYAERRALYRGSDDGLYYWVYPAPTRPDTDRYPTDTLQGRRAEYWGPIDPAEMHSDGEYHIYLYR